MKNSCCQYHCIVSLHYCTYVTWLLVFSVVYPATAAAMPSLYHNRQLTDYSHFCPLPTYWICHFITAVSLHGDTCCWCTVPQCRASWLQPFYRLFSLFLQTSQLLQKSHITWQQLLPTPMILILFPLFLLPAFLHFFQLIVACLYHSLSLSTLPLVFLLSCLPSLLYHILLKKCDEQPTKPNMCMSNPYSLLHAPINQLDPFWFEYVSHQYSSIRRVVCLPTNEEEGTKGQNHLALVDKKLAPILVLGWGTNALLNFLGSHLSNV